MFGQVSTERSKGNYSYRHHVEPRVQLYVPKEETFPIPLRYIDVARTAQSRIDDCWNIDANRNLSESWTRFTQFTTLSGKTSQWIYVVWGAAYNNLSNYQT